MLGNPLCIEHENYRFLILTGNNCIFSIDWEKVEEIEIQMAKELNNNYND